MVEMIIKERYPFISVHLLLLFLYRQPKTSVSSRMLHINVPALNVCVSHPLIPLFLLSASIRLQLAVQNDFFTPYPLITFTSVIQNEKENSKQLFPLNDKMLYLSSDFYARHVICYFDAALKMTVYLYNDLVDFLQRKIEIVVST